MKIPKPHSYRINDTCDDNSIFALLNTNIHLYHISFYYQKCKKMKNVKK